MTWSRCPDNLCEAFTRPLTIPMMEIDLVMPDCWTGHNLEWSLDHALPKPEPPVIQLRRGPEHHCCRAAPAKDGVTESLKVASSRIAHAEPQLPSINTI
jgi:hypothetical protein